MKIAIILIVSTFILSIESMAQCVPGPNDAAFFEHSNFRGRCVVRSIGDYPTATAIGLPNDTISSIKVGSNVQAVVCSNSYFEGRCENFTSDSSNLGNSIIGHDSISAIKVIRRSDSFSCEPRQDQVAFFQHSNFRGACIVRSIGDYRTPLEIGLRNDTISSIKIGDSVQLVLCRDTGFGGNCESFIANMPNLGSTFGHDKVSSAKVQARGTRDCLPGPDQIALFSHSNFLAPCVVKNLGDYSSAYSIRIDNDTISSILVGANVQAVLCRDTNFKGDCQLFTADSSNLGSSRIGHDTVSSVKVQRRGIKECEPGANEVAFFSHSDYISPCEVKGIGEYRTSSMIGLEDNSISSIKVGSSVQVCACVNENFEVTCEAFTRNDPNLGDNFRDFTSGHDIISSAKVQLRGAECKAVTTVPPQGASQIAIFNCNNAMRRIHLWLRDITAGASFVERGTLDSQWSSGSCPAGALPFSIPLIDGHTYEFVAVDPGLCGGRNDPLTSSCRKLQTPPIRAATNGPTITFRVD